MSSENKLNIISCGEKLNGYHLTLLFPSATGSRLEGQVFCFILKGQILQFSAIVIFSVFRDFNSISVIFLCFPYHGKFATLS